MTTEEQRERERKRWHRRYADPEFRKRESERSKKRMAEWLSNDKNREHFNANRREYSRKYYRQNREKVLEQQRNYRERIRAQEEML